MIKTIWALTITIIVLTSSLPVTAQQSEANPRDTKAIDEAVNGWWTASMKNH